MFTKTTTSTMTALAVAAALTACGGGGGGDSASTTPASPTSVTSSGVITGFGSVIVNGVRYETENSQIVSADDGTVLLSNPTDAQLQAVLGVGEVVRLSGTRSDDSNGRANVIRVDDELVGEVDTVNDTDLSFTVLGQTVAVTPDTIIDDSIIEAARGNEIPNDVRFGDLPEALSALLPVGLGVEISGFPTSNGIEATRIEDINNNAATGGGLPAGRFAEIKGFVRDISNVGANTFQLNGLTIQFDEADFDDDFPGGGSAGLQVGQFLEVKGTPLGGGVFDANDIELEDDFRGGNNEGEFEVEGVITSITPDASGSGGTIVIGGFEVQVNDVSQFSVGLRVEIKGRIQNDGSIVVTRVQDENEDTVRTEDTVASVGASSFTTRLGLEITPNSRSRLEDDTADDGDDLSPSEFLAALQGGDFVEARGFPRDGSVTWTRVEIDDAESECRLRGPVDSVTGTAGDFEFVIQGVTINVAQVSNNNFENAADQPIGRQAFFDQLDAGDVVQATSDDTGAGCQPGQLTAREVEFELADDGIGGGVGGGDDNGGDDNGGIVGGDDISGTVSNLSANGDSGTFDVAGRTVTVSPDTLIDASLVEATRGVELGDADLVLGNIPETLGQLVSDGLSVTVRIDGSGNAILIEDND